MSKILGIGFAVVLTLALVGGSAYILLRPQEARVYAGTVRRTRADGIPATRPDNLKRSVSRNVKSI